MEPEIVLVSQKPSETFKIVLKMEERCWAVIKFPHENDAVAAVPTSWLNGNMCYWPPWSQEKVLKAIKSSTPPESTTWQSHPFLPMRNNIFDCYETAIKKTEKATKNSDLESQSESCQKESNETFKRRKIVKTKLTRFASFEVLDDSSEDNETSPQISHKFMPEPPKLNDPLTALSKVGCNMGASSSSTDSEIIFGDSKRKHLGKKVLSLSQVDYCNMGASTSSLGSEIISGDTKRKRLEKKVSNDSFSQDENIGATSSSAELEVSGCKKGKRSIISSEHPSTSSTNTSLELQNITEYLKKIVRKQNIIQCTLTEVAEDVTEIKNVIKNYKPEQEEERNSIFISLPLPIQTQTDLEQFEEYLNDDTKLKNAVKEVRTSGGKDVYDLIYRATGKLITNEFASKFSYYGKKQKMKFSSLKLNKLLIDSAVKTFSSTEKEAEQAISKWLRRCSHYPEIFELDKSVCKNYFRQYGKVMRLIFKPKQRVIVVEYTNRNDYLNALAGSSEYEGHSFKVEAFEPPVLPPPRPQGESAPTKKKAREKLVRRHKLTYLEPGELAIKHHVSYVDKDEINEELAAMSGYSNIRGHPSENPPQHSQPKPKKAPKLNRVWKKEGSFTAKLTVEKPKKVITVKKKLVQTLAKKKVKEKLKMLTADQLELLRVIKLQALTIDDKYKVLDARDKLLRLNIKKSRLKATPTVGTCSDMCPEKERLLREIQHQVSIYEQDDMGRHHMNHAKAVKQYSRSSADQELPLPHELRPVPVLQMTMNYLMYHIMDLSESDSDVNIAEWFHFLWDRTRGIRKDMTQEALCCQGSVELVEQCARFHIHCSARLMGEDPSVFDQKINTENLTKCLQTLKYMYHDLELKGEKCPNEAEFRAYIILLNMSDGNFMWEVQQLRREIQKSAEVKFALQIYSAFEKRNYVKFFKLIKSTTYLNACILMRYFVQVRVQAIETLIKCFTPPKSISFYPIQELTNSLFFDDVETTIDFMRTYGVSVNKDSTSFMFERNSFSIPEYPYMMERSTRVEKKRALSVGTTVGGKKISPELYMQMQSHEVHNSFDKDGYLIHDEMFNEIELLIEERLLDEADSRESTPERKSMVTNIFAPKTQANITLKRTAPSSQFTQPKDEKNVFAQSKSDVFVQPKADSVNIFSQSKADTANIFAQTKTDSSNIFAQVQTEPMQVKADTNIFATGATKRGIAGAFLSQDEIDSAKAKENIFVYDTKPGVKEIPNLFAHKSDSKANTTGGKPISEGHNIFATSNIFSTEFLKKDPRMHSQKTAFGFPTTSASSEVPKNIFDVPKTTEAPKKGGFTFVLNKPQKTKEVPNIFATGYKATIDEEHKQSDKEKNEAEIRILEKEKVRLQEEIMKETEKEEREKRAQEEIRKRNEEIRRKNEEASEKRRLEAERLKLEEIERKKRDEQERIEKEKRLEQERVEREKTLEEERRKREEEIRRKQAELERQRRELEEKQKNMEIHKAVRTIVTKMVEAVDLKIRQETLKRIRENIKRRYLIGICKKWRSVAVRKMKKRKALDCSPIFVHKKNVTECAKDLHSKSQDLTLSDMKRYKYGRPLDIPLIKEPPVGRIELFHLTYSSLRRRLCELKEKWHQHIYWKVLISIPDIDEMITGLHKLEETLKTYIDWQLNKYGSTVYIEEHKTVTYCLEKQQGFDVKSSDANGFIFIAKNFNEVMQKRVFENLKDFGVYVKLPIVLILEDTANSEDYLRNLRDSGIVSDYSIYGCNLNSQVLPGIIDNALIFLSKRVEKYPPLEMDTLYSFISKNLCTEMWKKAGTYAKWNHEYNFCMRDPNIVINLYNEGLKLLSKIVMNKKSKEYAPFPEIFRDRLLDKVPAFLPCDYRYFPNFWTDPKYEKYLQSILRNLKLPKFLEKWPPENETDLIVSVSKYCTEIFTNPKDPLVSILSILKHGAVDDDYSKIIWTEAIEAIAEEKLKEQEFTLPKTIVSDVFNTFMVVYDFNMLNEYCSTEWFYRNNPIIESYKKIISNKLKEEKEELAETVLQNRKRTLAISFDHSDILSVISKAESVLRSPKTICLETKSEIEFLNRSIQDLEDSIDVVKRMDKMNLFKRFLEN